MVMFNSYGNIIRLTTFGESHGKAIGGVLDGFPSGVRIDMNYIASEMKKRRPGQSEITSQRDENDDVEFLSGIFEGKTTGCPIAFVVWNKGQKPEDYDDMKNVFRPSHADYTYQLKYGIRDYRGGGRASARETVARVVAGALCKLALRAIGINIRAYTSQVGPIKIGKKYHELDLEEADNNVIRCPDAEKAKEMIDFIKQVKDEGDSIGGVVSCVIKGCPIGLGEPVFCKLHAALGNAMLSINAAKGFEYGNGFEELELKGSEQNDMFYNQGGSITTKSNHSGGIQGGISNGQDIYFNVAFKAPASISKQQDSVDLSGQEKTIKIHGRHDPCILPRAAAVVESMAAITLLDFYLLDKTRQM